MIDKVQKLVEERPHAYLYVSLAKAVLWVTSPTLLVTVLISARAASLENIYYNSGAVSNTIQACQVLSIISITVLLVLALHRQFQVSVHVEKRWEKEQNLNPKAAVATATAILLLLPKMMRMQA